MNGRRLLELLNTSFPLFRLLGFPVRLHWALIIVLLWSIQVHRKSGWYPGWQGILLGTSFVALLYAVILIHELGHALAARRQRVSIEHILLWPLGGLAALGANPRNPREELIITFWGPAVHPILLTLGAPLYLLMTSGKVSFGFPWNAMVAQFFWVNLGMLLFNLIPAFPMDGGRFLRAFLATRMYAAKATVVAAYVGQIVSIGFLIVAVMHVQDFKLVLALIAITNIVTCEQAKEQARHTDPYEGATFDSYDTSAAFGEMGPDGWQSADEGPRRREKKPNVFKRWRAERARKREEAECLREQAMRERVDQLLDKVSRDGMPSLTPDERTFLNEASASFRKKSRS